MKTMRSTLQGAGSAQGCAFRRVCDQGLAGFTLMELLIASSLALFVVAGIFGVFLGMGREQRLGFADATLEQRIGNLQDQLTVNLRSMSASEGAIFTDAVTGSDHQVVGFRQLVVARGKVPDFPREEIRFNPQAGTVIHDPDRSVSGNEVTLFHPAPGTVLRNLLFTPSIDSDGSPDHSLINIWMELDDDSWAGRRAASGATTNTVIQRFFTVKMRNH